VVEVLAVESYRADPKIAGVSPTVYRPDIDGLRAVAVLLVIAYHAFPDVVRGGYVGVDVFFVISGYLITGLVVEPLRAGNFSFRSFYARRIRRIVPAMVVVLAAAFAIGWFLLSPPALAQLGKHIAASAAFVPNIVLWREAGYFDPDAELKPLLHLWSLGVEEQFYLAWPLALALVLRFARRATGVLLVLTAASFIACVAMVQSDAAGAFYSPLTRAWELFLGGLLRAVRPQRIAFLESRAALASSIGAALIAAAVLSLSKASTFPGGWALLPTIGTALIIGAGPGSPISRILSRRGVVAVGLISYPIYLWHWPLLSFAFIHAKGIPAPQVRVGLLLASIALAAATYALVEKPIRHGRRARWHVPALVSAMGLVAGVGFIAYWKDGFKDRFPVTIESVLDYASYDPAKDARVNLCWLPKEAGFSRYAPGCFLEPSSASERGVLLWGDSHAGRLYPGLRKVLGPRADIAQFTRDSCLPVLGHGSAECQESNARVLEEIARVKPRTVVLFGYWGPPSYWASGSGFFVRVRATLEQLRAAGVPNVVLVGAAPRWKAALPTLVYEDWKRQPEPRTIPDRLAVGFDAANVLEVDARQRALAQELGAKFVSLAHMLCDARGCLIHPPDAPGKLLTWDYGHLTTEGATFVAERMIAGGALP
jgi:peptidoglycan/LPS O-acetylase OafA/YrhL